MAKTKRVTITVKNVHDGMGGKHLRGQTPELPVDLADFLISRGQAAPVDGDSYAEAKKHGQQVADEARLVATKEKAEGRMKQFGRLPNIIRDLAREHGDEVVEMYRSGKGAEEIAAEFEDDGSTPV